MQQAVPGSHPKRGRGWWRITAGSVLAVLSLLVGATPTRVYTPGATDESTCGDAWGPRGYVPTQCYPSADIWIWAARLGLAVGVLLVVLGIVQIVRARRRDRVEARDHVGVRMRP